MSHTIKFFLVILLSAHIMLAKHEYLDGQTTNDKNGEFGLGTAGSPFANKWDIETEIDWFGMQDGLIVISETTILYGFNNTFGLQLFVPIFLKNTVDKKTSRGIGDIALQVVINIFRDNTHLFSISPGIQFPTGSIRKDPATSTGSFDFVGEFFFSHDSKYWYADAAASWDFTQFRHHQKTGSNYAYFLTGGYKMKFKKKTPSTYYLLLAMTGFYAEKDKDRGVTDPDSGGNVIFWGPYLSFLRKNILIEATFQIPFTQTLNGNQSKFDFYSLVSFEIQF